MAGCKSFTYREFFNAIRNSDENESTLLLTTVNTDLIKFVREFINQAINANSDFNIVDPDDLNKRVKSFCTNLVQRWKKARRIVSLFEITNQKWLDTTFIVANKTGIVITPSPSKPSTSSIPPEPRPRGRPKQLFTEVGVREKKRRITNLLESSSQEELAFATKTSLLKSGKRSAAELISQATEFSPGRALKITKAVRKANAGDKIIQFSDDEALAHMIDARLTKESYIMVRVGAKKHGADIYPSYHKIGEAKKRCYPPDICIDNYGASIPLQQLLNHTAGRFISEVVNMESRTYRKITLVLKWGCDGCSGHPEYYQSNDSSFNDAAPAEHNDSNQVPPSDSYLFLFTTVPLRLIAETDDGQEIVLWKNPRPSSTKYCRPIKFLYLKETIQDIKIQVEKMRNEISNLTLFTCKDFTIDYQMVMSMVDGKVINALTSSSSQSCFICGAKPSQMNDKSQLAKLEVKEDNLNYGLSVLHAMIKFMELVLTLGYQMGYAKRTKRGASIEEKKEIEERTKEIRKKLHQELGIKVDKVLPGGGTTNTGNTARRFFRNPKKTSEITGVDHELIERFSVIINVITCGENVDIPKFEEYTRMTEQRYLMLYSWHNLPPTVHKVLHHGAQVMRHLRLPIGDLSEEAQEARNKDYKRIREHHTRKSKREATTRDILNNLLITSDPVISHLRRDRVKKKTILPETKMMLLHTESTDTSDDDTDINTLNGSDSSDNEDY